VKDKITPAQRIVLILLLASLLAGVVTGASFYYRLAYVWVFLYVVNWVLSKYSLRGVEFNRRARFLRSQVGQIFEERFEIRNNSRLPRFWIEVKDESSLPGSRGSQVLSMIGRHETRSYLVRTRLSQRGVYPLGRTVLSSGDFFGMFPASCSFPAQESLLVYPMMVEVRAFPSPLGWLSGGEALRRRTQQITANASGVRDYEPGDPLKRIHWLSTARRNRFIVKEFELDPMAEIWIFLDAYEHVHVTARENPIQINERDMWRTVYKIPLPPSTEEYAVSIAASLARYFLQRGRVVGLVSAGYSLNVLPAERGGRQLGKILETLALQRTQGKIPLQALVEAEVQSLPRGSTVVMITPDTTRGVALICEYLLRRGMRPVIVLLDAASFGGSMGMDELANTLEMMRVPVCRVANGDDLSERLSEQSHPNMWG
jgi:uncharacterized protein (DUF58 family)